MITRRIVVNLVAFGVLAAALVAYGFFDLLGDPFASRTTVSTFLPSAAGLAPNFNVTLDGVVVGSVSSVELVHREVRVDIALDPGEKVPSDVVARVAVANALGEQEVQLVPGTSGVLSGVAPVSYVTAGRGRPVSKRAASSGFLTSGAVVPAAPDPIPAEVGAVVAEADRFLRAIPSGSLNQLLSEAAVALNGNSGNLRTIASSSELFSQEFLAQQQQFESLLQNAPPVLDTVTANAPALRQGLADTAVLAEVLATHSSDLVRLFSQGSGAASALDSLLTQNEPNLACTVHDASDIAANLGAEPNLSDLSTALSTNQLFFGAVRSLAVEGPAKALTSGDSSRDDQEWLRTQLLIPALQVPTQPQPIQYATPTSLPPVLPGAACDTEFGSGAGPVTQAGFEPAGPDARVVPPTAQEAQVRGGGTEPQPASANSDAVLVREPQAGEGLPLAAGTVVVGMLVTMCHRRNSRSGRPSRATVRNGRGATRAHDD